ncbi:MULTISPECIES: TIGR03808 family TAT-translocated repetitive protein [unclassified Rhizobium]|uniref:TIGR03808 family TAT-translocated repetitive protein n=1 Tax=unclassified Rhizobium TaxID=2613769 RepID=UPI0006F552B1|nr:MULTISPECIES: TIGR03808 family TAT-translocated repetitive protein [unclassified Rhizobium]KQV43595.1 Tat protein [Rhizobium sp. Root1212]KRD37779.1 Tat protein [Rhizobium sp. Root268]
MKRRSLIFLLAAAPASLAFSPAGAEGKVGALVPDARKGQSRAFADLLAEAARKRRAIELPAGDFRVSGIRLPEGTVLSGVPGATRLVQEDGGRFLFAEVLERLTLRDLILETDGQLLGNEAQGALDLRGVKNLALENCEIRNSARHGLYAEHCGGRIAGCTISGAADAGLFAVESEGLSITGNRIADCGNGGLLVHRWEADEDGTIISGNRISRIGARDGGTGENGNGINIFRAAGVVVSGNHVSDCAFSAIRANAATNVQISGNQCLRSGETAIYSEFGFQGAIVSDNLIDGAANGILIVNFNEGGRLSTVSGNIVRNLTEKGPYIHDGAGFGFGIAVEADTVVSGNVIENAPKWGLMLGWGPYLRDVVASGNVVRRAGGGCAVTVVEGAGAAIVTDNIFSAVRDGAVLGYRWNDKVTGDLAAEGAERFSHLTISGNRLG